LLSFLAIKTKAYALCSTSCIENLGAKLGVEKIKGIKKAAGEAAKVRKTKTE